MEKRIYFDNAATTWPKPPGVMEAMCHVLAESGANPGRGSHRMAMQASRILFQTRKKIAELFQVYNPNDIVFTLNTTMALNLAIIGFVQDGEHVICSAVEHNSVRRPLEWLRINRNVQVTYVDTSEDGTLNMKQLQEVIQSNTRLAVINHSSNVLGSIVPLEEVSEILKARGVKLLVDAAQSAGVLPIQVSSLAIDMLAFPGHKALYGPQGTGGLFISPDIDLTPILFGGTGSQSEAVLQPTVRPDRYESGTPNTPGIAGLGAGVDFVQKQSPMNLYAHEWALTQRLMEGLTALQNINILGPKIGKPRTGIVSFVMKEIDSAELTFILDQHFGIAVRAGFHCAPLAHISARTDKTGAVRISFSHFNTMDDVDYFLDAVKQIQTQYHP
jgi:cysteine desulfurase family protein